MILALIVAWLAYKKANENGRNGILWAFIGAGVFIGTQLVISFGIGIFIGFGIALWGWSESTFDTYNIPITIVAIIASFLTSWLLLKFLERPLKSELFNQPPSPPTFN